MFEVDFIKQHFIKEVAGQKLFQIEQLEEAILYNDYWDTSYTKYENRIGLASNGKFLEDSQDVVLDFPFKDGILTASMTKEDNEDGYDDAFLNEVIEKDEIDRLFDKKVFVNVKRFGDNLIAQVDNGIYPFFTCAEQPFKIDSFAFDTEALLISGNGANLGYINYYKGKFNAYQRTYVLDLFSENIQYIKWALKVLLPKRIAIEKSSSNTPYIVLSTLTDLRLPIPCKSKQSFIANLMQSLERKLSNQIAQYDSYNYLKQYLLRQMFI